MNKQKRAADTGQKEQKEGKMWDQQRSEPSLQHLLLTCLQDSQLDLTQENMTKHPSTLSTWAFPTCQEQQSQKGVKRGASSPVCCCPSVCNLLFPLSLHSGHYNTSCTPPGHQLPTGVPRQRSRRCYLKQTELLGQFDCDQIFKMHVYTEGALLPLAEMGTAPPIVPGYDMLRPII